MSDVYICYSKKDYRMVSKISEVLSANGIECRYNAVDQNISDFEAVKACGVFLLILSEYTNNSFAAREEIEFALKEKKKIITFAIMDKAVNSWIEYSIGALHWYKANEGSIKVHIDHLTTVICEMLGRTKVYKPDSRIEKLSGRVMSLLDSVLGRTARNAVVIISGVLILFTTIFYGVDISRFLFSSYLDSYLPSVHVIDTGNNYDDFFWSKDFTYYAVTDKENTLAIYQTDGSQLIQTVDNPYAGELIDVGILNNNQMFFVANKLEVTFYNLLSGELIRELSLKEYLQPGDEDIINYLLDRENDTILFLITNNKNINGAVRYNLGDLTMDAYLTLPETYELNYTRDMKYLYGVGVDGDLYAILSDNLRGPVLKEEYACQAIYQNTNRMTNCFNGSGTYYVSYTLDASKNYSIKVVSLKDGSEILQKDYQNCQFLFIDAEDHLLIMHDGLLDTINVLNGKRSSRVKLQKFWDKDDDFSDKTLIILRNIPGTNYLGMLSSSKRDGSLGLYIYNCEKHKFVACNRSFSTGKIRFIKLSTEFFAVASEDNEKNTCMDVFYTKLNNGKITFQR